MLSFFLHSLIYVPASVARVLILARLTRRYRQHTQPLLDSCALQLLAALHLSRFHSIDS